MVQSPKRTLEHALGRALHLGDCGQERVDIDEVEIAAPTDDDEDLLAMHDALDRFAALDPEKAEFVKLRYFVGLSLEETASALGVSLTTAKRWWQYARAWMKVEMRRN